MFEQFIVIRAGALGDFLLCLPVLRALRRAHPGARFLLAGPMPQAQLATILGLADLAVSIDDPLLLPLFSPAVSDQSLPFPVNGRSVAITWMRRSMDMAEALHRAGIGAVLAAPPFPPPPERTHVVDWLFRSVRALLPRAHKVRDASAGEPPGPKRVGADAPSWEAEAPPPWDTEAWCRPAPDVPAMAAARQWAQQWLLEHGIREPFWVLHPGSGSRQKNWPTRLWAETLRSLGRGDQTEGVSAVVLPCGPADEAAVAGLVSELHAAAGHQVPIVTLKDAPLLEVAAILERAALYLGHDSGLTHLAAGLGTPVLAVFGPTDPAVWRPRGPRVAVLGGTAQPWPPPAGTTLRANWPTVPEVASAARRLLESGQPWPAEKADERRRVRPGRRSTPAAGIRSTLTGGVDQPRESDQPWTAE